MLGVIDPSAWSANGWNDYYDTAPLLVIRGHNDILWGIGIDKGRIFFVERDHNAWVPMIEVPAKLLEHVPVFLEQHYPLLSTEGYPTISGKITSRKDVTVQVKGMSFAADCNV